VRVLTFIHDSRSPTDTAECALALLEAREERIEYNDVGAADEETGALREAMLTIGEATRIGPKPDGVFDDEGNPDVSAGVLLTEKPTGRRELHVGAAAVEALETERE
jgi:hypothetical protein